MTDVSLRYLLYGEDKSASKTATKVGSAFEALGSKIGGEVGDLLTRVGEGIDQISEHSKSVGKAMVAVGGVVAGVGIALQAAGSKDKAAMNALDVAIKNTGGSASKYADDIEKAVKANENYGISAADTKQALATLTTATGSPTKALQNIGIAANLAAAQHISLSEAATQLAKVLNGNGSKVLKQYGINLVSVKTAATAVKTAENAHTKAVEGVAKAQKRLNDLTIIDKDKKKLSTSQTIALHDASDNLKTAQDHLKTATDNLAKAMSANKDAIKQNDEAITKLGNKVQGRAAAQVDTFAGRIQVAKTKVGDWVGEMGNKFGPVITYAGGTLAALGTIYEAHIIPAIAKAIATATVWIATQIKTAALAVVNIARMAAQAIATVAVTVATEAWAAAQWLLNAALFANPIGGVILVIGLLVAATIEAYRHSTTFRNVVNAAFHSVQAVVGAVVGFITKHWKLLFGILTGPVGLAVLWIATHWGIVKAIFSGAGKFFRKVLSDVTDSITAPFRTAFAIIMAGFHAVEAVAARVKAIIGGGGPKINAHTGPMGNIPHASGTPSFPGGFGIVGDAGAELIEMPPGTRVHTASATARMRGASIINHITINVSGVVGDKRATGKEIALALQAWQESTGRPITLKTA